MRHISPEILVDPWYTSLSLMERQAWFGLLLTVDDQGRFIAISALIRSRIFPSDDIALSEIENAIQTFSHGEKLFLYEVDGVRYGQLVNWWKYQQASNFMARSKYPAPEGWADCWRVNSKGNKVDMSGNWEQKGGWIDFPAREPTRVPFQEATQVATSDPSQYVKDKENDDDNKSTAVAGDVFRVYSSNIGILTPLVADELKDLEGTYSREWVVMAIQEAVRSEARNLKYVGAILKRWKVEGLKKPWDKPVSRNRQGMADITQDEIIKQVARGNYAR
jgi:DnaD/phage-associated family protein